MTEIDPQSTEAPPIDEPTGRLLLYRTHRDRINRFIVNTAVLAALAAIAVAILAPIFAAARWKATGIICLSNVKQLCLATSMYAQDYDERMPNATRWIDLTLPYTKKDEAIYRCPVVKQNPPGAYGYAMNSTISVKRLEDIKAPEQTPLLYDTDLWYRNACAPYSIGLSRPGRHEGFDNIRYADGHAKAVRVDQKP